MPSQLIDNTAVSFVCARDFTYAGEKYKVGENFPQEKSRDIDTMVRSRYVIPVVDDLSDKPRHWYREVQQRDIVLEKLGRPNLPAPEFPVADYETHTPWEETQDSAALIHEQKQQNIMRQRLRKLNDKDEEKPQTGELVGPGPGGETEPLKPPEEPSQAAQEPGDTEGDHQPENPEIGPYDPADHKLDEVQEYLTNPDTSDEERDRVIALEKQGKNRKGIVG